MHDPDRPNWPAPKGWLTFTAGHQPTPEEAAAMKTYWTEVIAEDHRKLFGEPPQEREE